MPRAGLMAVVGGGLGAMAWLSAAMGVPAGLFLAYFAPLPMLLVGLAAGSQMAAIAAAVGIGVSAAFGGLSAAETFGGVHALPAWLVVHQALMRRRTAGSAAGGTAGGTAGDWLPIGITLTSLAAIAAFAVFMAGSLASGDDGIEASVRTLLSNFVEVAPDLGQAPDMAIMLPLVPVFLGLMAMAWQVMIVINAVLAQSLIARRGWNRRPTPRWSAIQLPDFLSWLLVGCAALALATSGDIAYLAQNAVIALAAPYFFAGLGAIHTFARRSGARAGVLLVFYVLLVVLFLVVAAMVIVLGILDQWLGWRRDEGANDGSEKE